MGQGLRLVTAIVLARLLFPEDFGIIAMASVITEVVMRIADLGFADAVIQRKEPTRSHLSTCFWTVLVLGLLFSGAAVGLSPLMSIFFHNELVGPVLALSSVAFVIAPLRIVHSALMRKRLQFFRFAVGSVAQAAVALAVAVSLALAGFGVWSLVIGNLAGQVALLISRWTMLRWHPSFEFSAESFRELWKFGARVTATRALSLLATRIDYLILGPFLTAAALGILHMARRIVNASNTGLFVTANRVAFPTFAIIQDEDERLRRGFLRSVAYLSLIFFPVFTGLAIVGPEVVRVFLGEKWIEAIVPMQIFCATGILGSTGVTTGPILRAKGRPGIEMFLTMMGVAFRVPALLLSVRFGIVGIAVALTVVSVLLLPVRLVIISKSIGVGPRDYLAALRSAVGGTVPMALVVAAARYWLVSSATLPDVALLAILVVLGAAVYFAALKLTKAAALGEMTTLAIEVLGPYARSVVGRIPLIGK